MSRFFEFLIMIGMTLGGVGSGLAGLYVGNEVGTRVGYEKGHTEGMAEAKINQPSACFAWWFGENTKQHAHELRQFCRNTQ